MSYGTVYVKKRYVIKFNKDTKRFYMTSPDGEVTDGTVAWKLSNQAFFDCADEVVHDYDLGIVDILGRLL